MLTVIGSGGRTNRVLWLLEELGAAYTHDAARPHSPEMYAANPLGQMPALRDGEHVLTDSLAILHYLADRAGRFTYASGTPRRAVMDARINFVLTEMEAPIWLMARHGFVLPEAMRQPGMRAIAEPDFAYGEARFERLLGDAEYFAGDDFTIADIVAAHTLNWAVGAKISLKSEAVKGYLGRMTARPAWQKVSA